MSDRDRSERPPLIPSGLYPSDKSIGSVWTAQREQAKQVVSLLHASGTQVRETRALQGRFEVMQKTLEDHDKRMDTIERTIAKWGGIVVGVTAAVQVLAFILNHVGGK